MRPELRYHLRRRCRQALPLITRGVVGLSEPLPGSSVRPTDRGVDVCPKSYEAVGQLVAALRCPRNHDPLARLHHWAQDLERGRCAEPAQRERRRHPERLGELRSKLLLGRLRSTEPGFAKTDGVLDRRDVLDEIQLEQQLQQIVLARAGLRQLDLQWEAYVVLEPDTSSSPPVQAPSVSWVHTAD
jgi:hypothetical protein